MKDGINKNNISKRNNFYSRKYNNLVLSLEIICLILSISTIEGTVPNLVSLSSEIHLVINGTGNQSSMNNSFYLQPSEVFVNGIYKESCKTFCELEYEENNIILIFNETLNSLEMIFFELDNIIEIDFSHFDFSFVTTMAFMCKNCINLEKINFENINTSSLVDMERVFYNCSQLTTLIGLNFDT